MQQPTTTEVGATLPARAVVELPGLAILSLEVATRSVASDQVANTEFTSALDLFAPSTASVITDDIVPKVLDNQVWSGELECRPQRDGSTTAVTLWVPHQRLDQPAATATILIGTAVSGHMNQVAPDPLTGLPTRVVLLDRLDLAIRRSRRNGDLMAALFVDLDGLKAINDRLGHEEGDTALILAADRIRGCMREGDTVARFGGDEFVVLCESLEHETQAERVAERILDQLGKGLENPLSASIGIAYDRAGTLRPLDLIGRADAAMYRAKSQGGNRYEVFDREMQGRIAQDVSLRSKLIAAFSGDGLDVAAQPLFELGTGRIVGVELFIRLREGDRHLLDGTGVLRLAREHSETIDTAMLGRAIAIARTWRGEFGSEAPRVHLNVSGHSLSSGEFVERVAGALDRHRLSPHRLAFEVDSSEVASIGRRQDATLVALADLGVGVVIDDYGSGPTSLRTIDRLQPLLVKVNALDSNRTRAVPADVVAGLVRAVATVGVSTCVKGIESQPTLERMISAGAFAGQGNALAPVSGLADLQPLLAAPARLGF